MWIKSTTMKELLDNRDGPYLKHDIRTNALQESKILYCYANTIVLETKSSHYSENGKTYRQFILLEDFYSIAKDKDIDFKDAVEYSILYGDVHIRCDCPAWLYWSYAYQGTQLKYIYGLPLENRAPERNNVELKGTICKHADKAMRYCLDHIDEITKLFESYYDKVPDSNTLIAVNKKGDEIPIGVKNGKGDIFYEQSLADEPEQTEQNNNENNETSTDDIGQQETSTDDNIDEGDNGNE